MKKKIHPFKNITTLIHTKSNATIIPSIYNVTKINTDMDVFTHYLYTKNINMKNKTSSNLQHNRLKLFKLN